MPERSLLSSSTRYDVDDFPEAGGEAVLDGGHSGDAREVDERRSAQ